MGARSYFMSVFDLLTVASGLVCILMRYFEVFPLWSFVGVKAISCFIQYTRE